ncbi:MAG: hypothetical protein GX456_01635 [Verrucomicrobia bacterium]|nr:hypothetical protein [Verrucomicrobiota bacterium]
MKPGLAQQLLRAALDELAMARSHLDYSAGKVADLPEDLRGASADQLECVEAFCSRFARTVDLLVNKVLRSLDRAELLSQGTLIDVVNRAEKRGFVERAEVLREMKDVRNIIAHDYAGAKLPEIFAWCKQQKPVFDGVCDRTIAYALRLLHK